MPARSGSGDARDPRNSVGLRALRALSGTVAAGLVVLAVVVGLAGWFAEIGGTPGPGGRPVAGHAVLAVLAVLCQVIVVDRRWPRPLVVALAAFGVLGLAIATVWIWWLA